MSNWLRIDRDILDNAKVVDAGEDGVLLFLEVLAANDRGSRDGILPPREGTARHLGRRLRANYGWSEARCQAALDSILEVELVAIQEDGSMAIDGWSDEWRPPMTNAERAAAWRARNEGREHPPNDGDVRSEREDRSRRNDRQNGTGNGGDVRGERLRARATSVRPSGTSGTSEPPPTRACASVATEAVASGGGGLNREAQLEQQLVAEGVGSEPARRRAIATLLETADPAGALQIAIAEARRRGENVGGFLAHILATPDSLRALLGERANAQRYEQQSRAVAAMTGGPPIPLDPPTSPAGPRRDVDPGPVYGESDPGGRVVPDQADTQRRLARDRAIAARSEWEAKHLPKPPGLRATQAEREAWQRACDETRAKLAAQGNRPPEVPK